MLLFVGIFIYLLLIFVDVFVVNERPCCVN